MKINKLGLSVLLMASSLMLLGACGSKESSDKGDGKTEITFWASPNPTQYKFWQEMAQNFEKQNKDITVKVSQMKESPSSEATIQSAVSSKTTPTMSENITRSFAAQLAESKAIIPISTLDEYDKIISERSMTESIKNWTFGDKKNYVLPVYSNPILFGWRTDVLKDAGVNELPKTYSDVLAAGEKLKQKYPDKLIWGKNDGDLADTTAWLRWFDFFPLYDAASDGNGYVSGGKFVADKDAFENVLDFTHELANKKMIQIGTATDPFENGDAAMMVLGPWNFSNWAEKYPELKYEVNYQVTAPVVPDKLKDTKTPKTYADAKGVVIYSNATKQQQSAAMKFMKFVYSDPKNDVELMEKTSLIPARDDSSENKVFDEYFAKNPQMKIYASYVKNSIPSMDDARFNDIQTALGEKAWVPVLRQEATPEKAWTANKKAVEEVLK